MTHKNPNPGCDQHEALVAYLYGEATADEGRAFASHLRACAACREELAAFERVRGSLQQWELGGAPVLHFSTAPPRQAEPRPFMAVLRELFGVLPLWTKAAGALAAAALVFAVLGTELRVENGDFSVRLDLLRRGAGQMAVTRTPAATDLEPLRAEVRTMVNAMLAENERRQSDEVKAMLVAFESQLQTMKATELAKLAGRIQEHNRKIRTLERDLDRREGLELTDILFGSSQETPARGTPAGADSGDR